MKKWLFPALGCLACALVLAAAAVLPYRAMAAQDAARLSAVHPLPSADVPTGLSEKAAQSDTAQALYARMRMLGEANTNYGDYGLGTPAEFDAAALSGATDALWEAGVLPQVFSLWLSDGSLSESGGTMQGTAVVDEFGFISMSHRALTATCTPSGDVVALRIAFTRDTPGMPAGVDWQTCVYNYAAYLGLAAVDDWQQKAWVGAPEGQGCQLYSPGAQLLLSISAVPSEWYGENWETNYDIFLCVEARSLSPASAMALFDQTQAG